MRSTAEALLRDANSRVFVVHGNGGMCGYIALNIHPALHVNGYECVIRELYVREQDRQRGIGKSLMDYAERCARRKGAKRLSFATDWQNEAQRLFYEACGFTRRCDFVVKYFG